MSTSPITPDNHPPEPLDDPVFQQLSSEEGRLKMQNNFPDLNLLLAPHSIAVVGATPDQSKSPGRIIPLLERSGFQGSIYPVNPKYNEIGDRKCYPAVSNVAEAVDLVVIMVPASAVLDVTRNAAESGAKFAVIMSSGFSEAGDQGRSMQAELSDISQRTGMRIYGPNCPGFLSFKEGLAVSFSPHLAMEKWRPGRVALVTQGGAMGRAVVDAMEEHGSPGLNYWLSPGNEADLSASDFLGWLAHDDGTDMILLVLEGFKDGRRFLEAAQMARDAGKPVALLKIGRSDVGVRATATHTAALTGADEVVEAAMKQCGVIRVDDVDELVDLARIVERYGVRQINNIGVCSYSGGSAALIADYCGVRGLTVDPPSQTTTDQMAAFLPPYAAVGNPLDLTTEVFRDPQIVDNIVRTFLSDDRIDGMLMPFPYHLGRINEAMAEILVRVANSFEKPIVAVGMSESVLEHEAAQILRQSGIPLIPTATKAVLAIEKYALISEYAGGQSGLEPDLPLETISADRSPITDIDNLSGTLTEQQSEAVLGTYGVPFARSEINESLEEAKTSANRIGYPVVVKAAGPGIAHKSDAGLVEVGIEDEDSLTRAYNRIVGKYRQLTGIENSPVKVAEYVSDGLETLCGITYDPSFGPVVTFGLGGIYAEIFADVTMRICPINADEAKSMISESKCFPILQGARGGPRLDVDSLAETISKLSYFASHVVSRLEGVDINPLKVRESGVVGLDALVVLNDNQRNQEAILTATASSDG